MMNETPVFHRNVLLCDDDKMIQELTCLRFAKLGLETVVAENGIEGVEAVRCRMLDGKRFDLIFMDIHMPGMDGLEAAAEINKLNTGTPIIAMTANATPKEREHYMANGMSYCLKKPVKTQELHSCLAKFLPPKKPIPDAQDVGDALTLKLIRLFVDNNKTTYHEIVKAIETEDIKLAHRLAHTLKGNARLIGKPLLQKAAGDVEHMLKGETSRVTKAAMNMLESELTAVLRELESLIPTEPHVTADTDILDDSERQALILNLETMLDGGDIACLQFISRLRFIPGSADLIRQIEHFKFDKAIVTLAEMKRAWS